MYRLVRFYLVFYMSITGALVSLAQPYYKVNMVNVNQDQTPVLVEMSDGSLVKIDLGTVEKSPDYDEYAVLQRKVIADAARDIIKLESGNVVMAINPGSYTGENQLCLWLSPNGGKSWPLYRVLEPDGCNAFFSLLQTVDKKINLIYNTDKGLKHVIVNEAWIHQPFEIDGDYKLPNLVPALDYDDDLELMTHATEYIPVQDTLFVEHVRQSPDKEELKQVEKLFSQKQDVGQFTFDLPVNLKQITSIAQNGNVTWIGTTLGLYKAKAGTETAVRHNSYGIDGPPASFISDLAFDSRGTLWVGTHVGLGRLDADGNGTWSIIRGKQELPVESVNCLAIDDSDRIWIGTSEGAILYKPYVSGRQWYYRAGKHYLIDDIVQDIVISHGGMPVYFKTTKGISKLGAVERTLEQKAEIIEKRLNQYHRRLGLVAACTFDDAENPTRHVIIDNDNDGLWTSYHVVAMSMAYAVTDRTDYLESAKQSMHSMIMLQNASGIPGLVARSVLPVSEKKNKSPQWRVTPDGKMIWKSDTSSDEIDGHFFAFYAYWEHIAQFIPEERELIIEQIRTVMDYIVDHNYQLIDWDGERTRWGFWNPENLNDDPEHYIENGLNAAQILSFLKVTYYITGDLKYKEHYDKLITEHGYLGNVLLEKKVFPDENNHSDNQLGFCALYPILQLEQGEKARNALQRAVRRHYKTLWTDGSAFFYFAAATIDPDFVDIKSAVTNLRQIPTDRRQWKMVNSNRTDVIFNPRKDRFDKPQLITVLPADETNFNKWNKNPYYPDSGGNGKNEDDGASWLLAYWMGRYHGFIDAAVTE